MVQNGANVLVAPPEGRLARPFARSRLLLVALPSALLFLCALGAATREAPGAVVPPGSTARLRELQREAVDLLKQAGRAGVVREEALRALGDAARRLEKLGAEPEPRPASAGAPAPRLGPELRGELRRAARELLAAADAGSEGRFDSGPILGLLERARAQLEGEIALGLSLQGSYSQTKAREPVYGGHASAMGPAPVQVLPAEDNALGVPSPAQFEEGVRLPTRTYCGGPTKDHILESGGSGVALIDYDGDGRLDIYLVTAAELTTSRGRVSHRNALYRNLGQWKFEDVSKKAGVDAAAWGNGVCAGDFDGDGRLDLYVTNWGPNLLFRNQGEGTFSEVAAQAGVEAGGWSTGCAFLDADATATWTSTSLATSRRPGTTSVRAQRTLLWRSGPHIMVGPAGLPGESDLYFENLGNGRFREAAEAHGLGDRAGAYGFGVVATDYDDDGFVDLFVANDSNPNFLYHNRGDGRFESVGLPSGVAVNAEGRAQAGMGVDAGDYDGDGRTGPRPHRLRPRHQYALSQPRRPPVRRREHRRRPRRAARSSAWAGGRPSSTPTWTACWTCSSPTATSSRTSGTTRSSGRRTARGTSSCSTRARPSATSRIAPEAASRWRGWAAAWPWAISTTTAIPTSW